MYKILLFLLLTIYSNSLQAKKNLVSEQYGNTLNIGAGIGYYGYINNSLGVAVLNFEFDVARNLTLAPFIGFYSYRYGTNGNGNSNYTYRALYAPLGVKGTYYFDEFLGLQNKWDFYTAGSLGILARRIYWNDNYNGPYNVYTRNRFLYLDAHLGLEYHITNKVGFFADISTGTSSIGLAFHFK